MDHCPPWLPNPHPPCPLHRSLLQLYQQDPFLQMQSLSLLFLHLWACCSLSLKSLPPKSYLFFKNYIKPLLFQETFPKFQIWVSCTLLLLLRIFKPWLIFYSNHRFICRSCTKYNLLNNSPESYISLLPSQQWIYTWRSITPHARIYTERLETFFCCCYISLNSTKKLCWQVTMLGRAKTNGMVKFKTGI